MTVGDPSPKKRRRRSVREFWCNFQTNLMQPKLDYAESPKRSWGNFINFSPAIDGIPPERGELKRYMYLQKSVPPSRHVETLFQAAVIILSFLWDQ